MRDDEHMLDLWIGETVDASAQVLGEFKIASITDSDEAYFIAHVGNGSLVGPRVAHIHRVSILAPPAA